MNHFWTFLYSHPFAVLPVLLWASASLSHIGCGVSSGKILHANSHQLVGRGWLKEELASEDLTAGIAEILREESVDDGVDAGIPVGQAMGDNAEGEGDIVQGELPKFCPHCDDVVGEPGDQEDGNNQQDGLGRLKEREEIWRDKRCYIAKLCLNIRQAMGKSWISNMQLFAT